MTVSTFLLQIEHPENYDPAGIVSKIEGNRKAFKVKAEYLTPQEWNLLLCYLEPAENHLPEPDETIEKFNSIIRANFRGIIK
jgi:hypothetical protein